MRAPHSVLDIAEYILQRKPDVSTLKLQKLCYYAQAWSLVWDGEPLFGEQVQAWMNGPGVRELRDVHKGDFSVRSVGGGADNLRPEARETVDAVLDAYGGMPHEMWDNPAHIEPYENLSEEGQARLADIGLQEAAMRHGLAKFKVTEIADRARMWAIKNDNVYLLLWWDPDHEVESVAPSRGLRKRRKRS